MNVVWECVLLIAVSITYVQPKLKTIFLDLKPWRQWSQTLFIYKNHLGSIKKYWCLRFPKDFILIALESCLDFEIFKNIPQATWMYSQPVKNCYEIWEGGPNTNLVSDSPWLISLHRSSKSPHLMAKLLVDNPSTPGHYEQIPSPSHGTLRHLFANLTVM